MLDQPDADGPFEYSRRYLDDTLVLETDLSVRGGEARLLDCFAVRCADRVRTERRQILRMIEGVRGSVELEVRVAPRFDYGAGPAVDPAPRTSLPQHDRRQ